MMNWKKIYPLLLVISGLILFVPFLGKTHLFDWDEINFAESAREMIVTGDYLNVQINFMPFWEKPPLFIWMQVLSMKVFGINEFAARFPNAVCGIVTLLLLFYIGRKIAGEKIAVYWPFIYATSLLPFFYFKSGIIDPWFNLFIFLGVFFMFLYLEHRNKRWNVSLSALFVGLAVLTKGPVGLLVFSLAIFVYLFFIRFRIRLKIVDVFLFLFIFVFVGGFWFILQYLSGNEKVLKDFIEYQVRLFETEDAGHGGFPGYHFVVVFLGVFPASVFALRELLKPSEKDNQVARFRNLMVVLLLVVLILFSIVKTKIVHYSSMSYFPLTFLAAMAVKHLIDKGKKIMKWQVGVLVFVSFIWFVVNSSLYFIDKSKWKIIKSGIIKDEFVVNNLKANAHWQGWEWLIGLVFFIAMLTVLFLKRKELKIHLFFAITLLYAYATMLVIVPKIEYYTQRAAIDFFKKYSKKDAYIKNIGYKSYAVFFYTKKLPLTNKNGYDQTWLIRGDIDKHCYFIFKINRKETYLNEIPGLEILGEKNGFVFALRRSATAPIDLGDEIKSFYNNYKELVEETLSK